MARRHALRRPFAVLLALAQLLLGCPPSNPPLTPWAGWQERREPNYVAVPGGLVDVAGGNLLIERTDLVIDTRLGRERFGAVYDGAGGRWRWSFESQYDGAIFTDASGARHGVGALAAGAAIPGTHWVKLDATRMKTKGGLVHEYDGTGLLAARYWSSDPHPRIVYRSAPVAGQPRVTEIEQCTSATVCTPLFQLGYDGSGRLTEVVDRAGRRAEYGWDGLGRLVAARDALDVARGWLGFRYEYAGTLLTALTNSEGERTSYGFSRRRGLVRATREGPGAPTHRFQYQGKDASGIYHTRYWNPLDEEQRFAYDAEGRVLERLEVATGDAILLAWGGERPNAQTLPNGATTLWTWSGDDVQSRTDPSGNVVVFTYHAEGVSRENPRMRAIASIHDSLGGVETRRYDASGRLVERIDGAGESVLYGWSAGALVSETVAGVTRTFSQVGEHGHAGTVTVLGVTELRSFDAVGNLLEGSIGRGPLPGGIVRRRFDEDRNLATLELAPQGAGLPTETLTLRHRSDGQRLEVLRGGDDHVFVYDAFGRTSEQRERVDGAWHVTRFGYDAAGRLASLERPNGMREEVDWGPGGRPQQVRRLRDGLLESSLDLVHAAGELVRVDDSLTGSEHYAYDAAGRRIVTTFPDGEQLLVQHDPRSRIVAEGFVSSTGEPLTTLLQTYDLADRRIRLADPSGTLLETSYESGRVAELRYGNGLVRSFGYHGDGTLASSNTQDASATEVEATTLTHALLQDAAGVDFLRQRATTSTYGAVDVTTVEEYDLSPMRGGARVARWNDGLSGDEAYVFDARSNLLAAGDASFQYNTEGNRLLSVTSGGQFVGQYSYDEAGFATARNGQTLAWNAAGRLVGHGADRLEWDGLGRLREAEIAGIAVRFRFGGRVQADPSGVPLAVDLGEVLVGLGGGHRYRHLDFRGNVKWVSDDTGAVVAHYRYAPYGLDAVFGSDEDPVRFAARSEIGELMLLGERVYDPSVGRFLSPDPLFQIVNQFAYTLGNPVWFSDPNGTSPEANDAATAFDNLVGGLGLISAVLATLAVLLRFGPLPHLHAIAAVLGLVSALLGLLLALMLLFGKPRSKSGASPVTQGPGGSGGGSGGTGGGGGAGGSLGGGFGGGCSPAQLTAVPRLGGWLPLLAPLQLLLGFLLLRRRRREASA
jgi:RHS repeat-associated protein